MTRALTARLRRLEASATPDDRRGVHSIPAHTDEEFAVKRRAMIEAGSARPGDLFLHLQRFAEGAQPVTHAHSIDALLTDIAARGRRIFDSKPEHLS